MSEKSLSTFAPKLFKKGRRALFIFLGLAAIAFGLERLYYRQNGGFSLAKITSSLTPKAASFSPQVLTEVDSLLNQPFHFFDSGGTSFVFLGEDNTTMLKLFKHHHLAANRLFLRLRFPGALDTWRIAKILQKEKKHGHKRQAFFFNSCALAEQSLKEETGLLFLCLHPDTHFSRQVRLIDAWGISHPFDLSRTEFALQKRAEPFFSFLEKLLPNKELAQNAIDALVELIHARCAKGIGDRDPNLLINFGFIEGKAVEFDLGSYFIKEDLKSPFATAQEVFFVTHTLREWLQKYSPDLLDYLLNRLILK